MASDTAKKTLYLVDGTSQLFRAYFAIRGLSNREGLPTNAVYGFTTMLRKLLKDEKPEHLAVAFDPAGATFRHDRYADYKANRPEVPEDLNVQMPYAKQVCDALRIPALEVEGYEADDLIATLARLAREGGYEVVIVASDKDLLQLVGEGVSVLNPVKNVRLDADGVEKSFGVAPERVSDVLGLMGDSVDNIPGVPGVGEKTALAMVRTYGALDDVIERARRFVAVFEARDSLLRALDAALTADGVPAEAASGLIAAADETRSALSALADREADPDLKKRFEAAIELVGALEPRLGEERGSARLRSLRNLKRELKALDRGSGRRVWSALLQHAEQARLSRELATINREVPVSFDPTALKLGDPDRGRLHSLFDALGFTTLKKEFVEGDDSAATALAPAAADYEMILSPRALEKLVEACRMAARISVRAETDAAHPLRADLVGLAVARGEGSAAYVPVGHDYPGVPEQLPAEEIRRFLGPVLADPSISKVAHDVKRELHVLGRWGLPVEGWTLDTMVAAFLLDPGRSGFDLGEVAEEYLGRGPSSYEEVAGPGSKRLGPNRVAIDRLGPRAARSADLVLQLAGLLEKKLEEQGLDDLYRKVDAPLLPLLARMESHGIRVDTEILGRMSERMHAEQESLRAEIYRLAEVEFNIDSPKQLREVLFDRLRLKSRRKTAKGGFSSTDARTLEELAAQHPIARKILDYRELAKLKGTYVDALPRLVHPETGRVHTCFHPTGAATGRLSSSDPNLQNIPARSAVGLEIRSAFVPGPGCQFLASDYSQVELRILAHLSGDPELLDAFRRGEDIHRHTAARVFGVASELVDDLMRRRAKAVNFGIVYGMSEARLAADQGMRRTEARQFIQAYFERFARVKAYIDETREQVLRDGAVRTLFGRVRFFPQLRQRTGWAVREQALRAAVNTTVQGTAADLMKMAMLRVDRDLRDAGLAARLLLQVHDELLLEVPEEEVDATRALVRSAMEEVYRLEVPLLVDQKSGSSWKEVT